MIKSMTGYGRAVEIIGDFTVTAEIKSVNHRYFEFSSRVSRAYGFIEDKLKSYVQSRVSRGKIECSVQIESQDTEDDVVSINNTLANGYMNAIKSLCETYSLEMNNSVDILASKSDIFTVRRTEADENKVWEAVRTTVDKAIDSFISMREHEGAKMREDILSRADFIIDTVAFIEERSPQTVIEYKEKLTARINELIGDAGIDEQRILTEAAIYADKIAVAEETVRLRSHIDQLRVFLDSREPIGRKLDFLVQEINREANTIGSKSQDIDIARRVIDIKAEVEKIREQIQNIE